MRYAAPSRAYWSGTFHCRECKRPRPTILRGSKRRCIMHQRVYNAEKMRKSRARATPQRIAATKQWKKEYDANTPLYRVRSDGYFFKIRAKSPKSVPGWVSMESLYPIYRRAQVLDEENPDLQHAVCHIYPIFMSVHVCGLHTIDNLRIVSYKRRKEGGFCPNALT